MRNRQSTLPSHTSGRQDNSNGAGSRKYQWRAVIATPLGLALVILIALFEMVHVSSKWGGVFSPRDLRFQSNSSAATTKQNQMPLLQEEAQHILDKVIPSHAIPPLAKVHPPPPPPPLKEAVERTTTTTPTNDSVSPQRADVSLHAAPTCLSFVHITKTGGTAIEKLAAGKGIAWGACRWVTNSSPFDKICNGLPLYNKWNYKGGQKTPWHDPSAKYDCNELFAVVRNPYTRSVSEFFCKWGGHKGRADAINAQSMNGWIQHHVSRLRRTGNPNWDWAFHGEPQTSYMYYRNGTAKVQHILHFEALDEEFDQLMKAYQLPVRYSEEVINPSNFKRTVSVRNLSDETVALINRVYARDFELFGYKQKLPSESWDSYSFNATFSTSSFGVPHGFR